MNKGDIYVNNCDERQITYTITSIEGDMLTVYSSNLDRTYVLHHLIFRDTMRALGFTLQEEELPALYRIYYINHEYYSDTQYSYINQAIEAGKIAGFEFRVELGTMYCCAWDAITGLRFFSEYQRYTQDQATKLSQVEGTYD